MNIHVEFWVNDIDSVVDLMLAEEGALKPLRFSFGERANKDDIVADVERFEKFRRGTPSGFFLHLTNAKINLMNNRGDLKKCHGYFRKVSDAELFVRAMMKLRPIFGFAASYEEFEAKHGLHYKSERVDFQVQLGLNLDRKIPGLYWQTFLSDGLIERFDLSVDDLINVAVWSERIEESGYLFCFYPAPGEWTSTSHVDIYVEKSDAFFSIRRAVSEIPPEDPSLSYSQLSSSLSRPLRKWYRNPTV